MRSTVFKSIQNPNYMVCQNHGHGVPSSHSVEIATLCDKLTIAGGTRIFPMQDINPEGDNILFTIRPNFRIVLGQHIFLQMFENAFNSTSYVGRLTNNCFVKFILSLHFVSAAPVP